MDEEKLTMADFEDEINASFVKFRPGQAIKGTVVAIDEDEIALDLQSYSRGIIPKEEWGDYENLDSEGKSYGPGGSENIGRVSNGCCIDINIDVSNDLF